MLQILPFALGLVTGAFALKLAKSEKTRESLRRAQSSLRGAAATGLAAIETSSGQMREKLAAPAAMVEPAVAATAPAPRARARKPAATVVDVATGAPAVAAPARKPRARKPAPRSGGGGA
ncbi:MAG: hypothetical protein REI09_01880 [Candidatus Dactylopiibacterium sp.]|nr:hypothetical protein [Candidatus Dactylopiibacterium sp.]